MVTSLNMNRRAALFVFTILYFLTLCSSLRSLSDYLVLHIEPSTNAQVEWVRTLRDDDVSVDFWSVKDVMVDSERGKRLQEQLHKEGIAYWILIPNVQVTIDAERTRQRKAPAYRTEVPLSFDKFYRYGEIVNYLQYVTEKNSTVASLHDIGRSTEGRQILCINISTGGKGTRPLIIIDATFHAREWVSSAMALYIIQQLVENPKNADLISEVDWHIIPVMNPDGYEYSHTDERLWRRTRSNHTCGDNSKVGVDPNRNFDHAWGGRGSSSSPCSDLFAGPFPFSEPETRALRDHVTTHEARTALYLSLHSFGKYILCPWGYTLTRTDDWRALKELGERATSAMGTVASQGWKMGTAGQLMYVAPGISMDWVRHDGGVQLSYTAELEGGGSHGFDIPASQLPDAVSSFFPVVRVFGEHVASPYFTYDDRGATVVGTKYILIFTAFLTVILLTY